VSSVRESARGDCHFGVGCRRGHGFPEERIRFQVVRRIGGLAHPHQVRGRQRSLRARVIRSGIEPALRERDPVVPIIILTAKAQEADKVRGLDLGADDYVVKPFGVAELLARVDAALRRKRLGADKLRTVRIGEAAIDFDKHTLVRDGRALEVTAQEMRLLRFLIERDGRLLSRQQIIDAVWGSDYYGTDRTVDNFVGRLRAKVEIDPKRPRHILTIRGAGYRFSLDGEG
jgi:DNA-binding response OmpR family regulator